MPTYDSDEAIFFELVSILKEALRGDPSKITMDSRILVDLNAESLDLLDIRFRMEKVFGFKIQQDEIIKSLGDVKSIQDIRDRLTIRSLLQFVKSKYAAAEKVS